MQIWQDESLALSATAAGERVIKKTHELWLGDRPATNFVDYSAKSSLTGLDKPETFSVVDLKERGWTKTMMSIYLSVSDVVPVVGATAGRPKQLYLKSHILSIEAKTSFKERVLAAAPRRQHSNALFCDKSGRLLALVQQYKIDVPIIPLDDLRNQTVAKFGDVLMPTEHLRNEVQLLTEPIELACSQLHAFTWNYGVRDARLLLRKRIYTAIAEQYPHLSKTIFRLSRTQGI